MEYHPDFRQAIADSWPDSIDDQCARNDWNWKPGFSLEEMTKDILENLPNYKF
jgi:nucleoside-diphosphate-sugar epimerase